MLVIISSVLVGSIHECRVATGLRNSVKIISYPYEGHWFRKKKNVEDATGEILRFFCRNMADNH